MTVNELLENIEIQTEVVICYYDEDKNERIELQRCEEIGDKEIKYMYVDNDSIYIEIDIDNE